MLLQKDDLQILWQRLWSKYDVLCNNNLLPRNQSAVITLYGVTL